MLWVNKAVKQSNNLAVTIMDGIKQVCCLSDVTHWFIL